MKTIKFINEVGNKIQVKIKDYNGVGENSKTKENIKFSFIPALSHKDFIVISYSGSQ